MGNKLLTLKNVLKKLSACLSRALSIMIIASHTQSFSMDKDLPNEEWWKPKKTINTKS